MVQIQGANQEMPMREALFIYNQCILAERSQRTLGVVLNAIFNCSAPNYLQIRNLDCGGFIR